jgi:transposase
VPGNRLASITPGRRDVYEALRRQGMSKKKAAKISNAGKSHAGRSAMARKAARTRKRHGR